MSRRKDAKGELSSDRSRGATATRLLAWIALATAGVSITASSCASRFPTDTGPATVSRTSLPPAGAPPDPLGTTLPTGAACNGNGDCPTGNDCFSPDFKPGRGVAPECGSGRDCAASAICDDGNCVPRCTRNSCGHDLECAPDGLCKAIRCDLVGAPACPLNHRCDGQSGRCVRTTCATAGDCDEGTCWKGVCYAHAGFCAPKDYCCPP